MGTRTPTSRPTNGASRGTAGTGDSQLRVQNSELETKLATTQDALEALEKVITLNFQIFQMNVLIILGARLLFRKIARYRTNV